MIEEYPSYLLVTVSDKYYFKAHVAFLKTLGGVFDWNTKKWRISKIHKLDIMRELHITFTLNEINEGEIQFQNWWNWLLTCPESLQFP